MHNYGINDGLPSSQCYYVFEDANGYIWVATDRGISKFNGYEFNSYSTADGLTDNVVFKIDSDSKNRLWFEGYNGGFFYKDSTGFHSSKINDSITSYSASLNVQDFAIGDSDTLWAICGSGTPRSFIIVKYHEPSGYFKILDSGDWASSMFVYMDIGLSKTICAHNNTVDIERRLELGRENRIRYAGLEAFDIEKRRRAYTNRTTRSLKIGNERYLLSFDSLLLDIDHGVIIGKYAMPQLVSTLFAKDRSLYIGTLGDGIEQYEIQSDSLVFVQKVLENAHVSSIFLDRNNNFWYTTLFNSLFFQPQSRVSTVQIPGYSLAHISKIEPWNDGFVALSKNTDICTFQPSNKLVSQLYNFDDIYLHTFTTSDNNKILISTLFGVKLFNLNTAELISRKRNSGYTVAGYSGNDTFLVMRKGQISKIDGHDFDAFRIHKPKIQATCIYMDRELDEALIGTYRGVILVKGHTVTSWHDELPFSQQRITSITKANDVYLLGTIGNGLYLYNPLENSLENITKNQGLISNLVNDVCHLGGDVFAVASNSGIEFINLSQKRITFDRINIKNGLLTNEVKCFLKWKHGLLVGTANGINFIDLRKHNSNARSTPVVIDSVTLGSQLLPFQSCYEFKENSGILDVYFTGLDYTQKGNIEYAYRLLPQSQKWITTKERKLVFQNLSYGEYELGISVINPSTNSVVDSHIKTIKLLVVRPFYRKTLFIVIASLVFAALVAFFSLNYVRINREQAIIQNQLIETEQRALKAQMNPHFLFNAMNSVQNFIAINDKKAAFTFISKFSTLVRAFLENSSRKTISLHDELEGLKAYLELEKIRFDNKFDYTLHLSARINSLRSEIEIPGMLIQPILENAILHGIRPMEGKGFIQINVVNDKSYCIFTICDNGIGRKRSAELNRLKRGYHESVAIKNIERRIELVNKLNKDHITFNTIDIDENGETGTLVIMKFPLKEDWT